MVRRRAPHRLPRRRRTGRIGRRLAGRREWLWIRAVLDAGVDGCIGSAGGGLTGAASGGAVAAVSGRARGITRLAISAATTACRGCRRQIEPRAAAGHQHAGRRAKAAQPLQPDSAGGRQPAGEPRHLAAVRVGGTENSWPRARRARGAEQPRRRPDWPTGSACRRPTTAMRAGRSSRAPPAADRVRLAPGIPLGSSAGCSSRWFEFSPRRGLARINELVSIARARGQVHGRGRRARSKAR